mgnify:CR=1 FL=1
MRFFNLKAITVLTIILMNSYSYAAGLSKLSGKIAKYFVRDTEHSEFLFKTLMENKARITAPPGWNDQTYLATYQLKEIKESVNKKAQRDILSIVLSVKHPTNIVPIEKLEDAREITIRITQRPNRLNGEPFDHESIQDIISKSQIDEARISINHYAKPEDLDQQVFEFTISKPKKDPDAVGDIIVNLYKKVDDFVEAQRNAKKERGTLNSLLWKGEK